MAVARVDTSSFGTRNGYPNPLIWGPPEMRDEMFEPAEDRPKLCHLTTLGRPRQAVAGRATTRWQPRFFSTVSTPRILQRSRFRRGLASAQWSWATSNANDSGALDRRGELLLRVLHLDELRHLRAAVRARVSRVARPRDHRRIDLRRHRHRPDGAAVAAQQGRRIPRVPGARVAVHPAAAEARAHQVMAPWCKMHR